MAALPTARAFSRNRCARLLGWIFPGLAMLLGAVSASAATATTTALASSSSTIASGTAVTLTATVSAGSVAVSPGQVAFCDASAAYCTDIHRLGTAQLVAGTATLKFIPGAGTHSYKAIFLGTNSDATSLSSALSLTVTGTSASTTSVANVSASSEMSRVSGKGSTPPTGTVSFLDTTNANYVLGTATLASGASVLALNPSPGCATGQGPGAVAVGDFNGDGVPDVVTADAIANTLTVCLAHLNGTFTTSTRPLPANTSPSYLTAGDFNGDGVLDLVVFESSTTTNDVNSLALLAGVGDGTFVTTNTNLSVGSAGGNLFAPVSGDFNGDGNADLAVIQIGYLGGYQVYLFLGNGDGSFQPHSTVFSSQTSGPTSLFAADLNNDGRTDLVFGDLGNSASTLMIELGNSTGTFAQTTQTFASVPGTPLTGADFNGDGKTDLALIEGTSIVFLNGNGDGTFTAGTSITPSSTPSSLTVADFNGDGNADLAAILPTSPYLAIYPGSGHGTFSTPTTTSSTPANALATGDFNGDGFTDLAVLPSSGNSVVILLAAPTSSSSVIGSVLTPVGTGTHDIIASYPGDANFAASTSSTPSALTAQQASTALTLTPAPATSTYGQQVTLSATLSPYTAQAHTTDSQTITFTTHNGTSTLGTGRLSNGVATLSLTSLPAGVSTLAASYGGDPNFSGSLSTPSSYTVAVLTSTTLAVTSAGSPVSSVGSGALVTLTATVEAGSTPVTPGQVAFCDASAAFCSGSHRLGTAQLTSAGTATLSFTPTLGSHSYNAIFLGTTANSSSFSPASSLTVSGSYPTSTMLQPSGAPGNYTLTAIVTGPGLSSPSGTVSFPDTTDGASLGSALLSALPSSLTFSNPLNPITGVYPNSIDTGDFNRDGIPDLVVTNSQDNTLTLLLGSAGGTFTASTVSSTSANPFLNPSFVAVADFNSDGIPDLAVANTGANQVLLFLGRSNGTFSAPLAQGVGSVPYALTVADLNHDGIPDLAVANTFANSVTLLLGNGDGTFNTVNPVLTTGSGPTSIVAADFDNDGNQDIAVTNLNDFSVTVFYGEGDGTFASSVTTLANVGHSYHLVATDLNNDGIPDLAVANSPGDSITILLGQGNRTFTTLPIAPATGSTPNWMTAADLNGDGIPDLITSNRSSSGTVSVLLGNGDGTFQAALSQPTGNSSNGVVSADFNGDGFPDLAIANSGSNTVSILTVQPSQSAQATAGNIAVTGNPSIAQAVEASYPGDTTHSGSVSTSVTLSPLPDAAIPVFSPTPGTYTSAQTVTLSSSTASATLFYTTDGSAPTSSSPVYSTPLSVPGSETIHAIASAPNYQTSAAATAAYTINYPPHITQEPNDQTILAGNMATLSVTATGTAPLAYQWYQVTGTGNLLLPNATSATYTPTLNTSSSFLVEISNPANMVVTSRTANITVITPPRLSSQSPNPVSAINTGQTAILSVSVSGTAPNFQWYTVTGGTPSLLPGQVSSSYTTPALVAPASYQVRFSNAAGSATASFQILIDPVCTLSVQPTSTALAVLATAQCTDAQGQPLTLTLTWGDNSTPASSTGTSPATLTRSHMYSASGTYTVTLSATDAANLSSVPITAQVSPSNSPVCTLGSIQGQPPTPTGVNGTLLYPVTVVASCTDPQGQPLSLSLNWGDGTAPTAAMNGTNSHNYAYPNPANSTGIYNVVLTANDTSGLSGSSAPQSFQIVPPVMIPPGMSASLPSNTMTSAQPSTIPTATQVTFLCTTVSAVFPNSPVVTTLPSTYGISCTSPTVSLGAAPTPVNVVIRTTAATTASFRPIEPTSPFVLCGVALPLLSLLTLLPLTPGRRRRQLTALSLIFVLCLSLSACGGSFQAPPSTPTPSALYYVTVLETVVNSPAPTGFIQTSLIVPLNVTPSRLSGRKEQMAHTRCKEPLVVLRSFAYVLLLLSTSAGAQLCNTTHTTDLYCLIPTAFHTQASPFNAFFTPFGTELSELPTARPAGLVLKFEHGLPVAASESLGAVFSERAEALGRNRLFLGFTYQNFHFSNLDGNDLSGLPIVLFDPSQDAYTATQNRFDIRVNQYTAIAALGLTDRLDLSVAVPFERLSMAVSVRGNEYGLGGASASVNEYIPASSSGLADVVAGLKAHVRNNEKVHLAAGLDVRIPNGDELNFLGSGTYGLRPYLAVSTGRRISPHANLGFQANGHSILNASTTGAKQRLPDNFIYNIGANFEAARRWTVVADFLGRAFFQAPRLADPTPVSIPGFGNAASVQPYTGSFTTNDLSLGVKTQAIARLIFTGTVTLQLNDGGLRAKVVPLAGLSYAF